MRVVLLLVLACSGRLLLRRVSWDNTVSCSKPWLMNPTLRAGNWSVVAGRASGHGRSTSALQWRKDDKIVWCRQFLAQRVVAVLWETERNVLLVFVVGLKDEPHDESGPFAVASNEHLPVLFATLLNTTHKGERVGPVLRLSEWGHFSTPLGAANSTEGTLIVNIQSWGGDDCIGPAPLTHTMELLLVPELSVGRVCRDYACGSDRHCNMSISETAREPNFDAGRLKGVPLVLVVGTLSTASVAALIFACFS